jgi:membrane-associated phospholipid phosphatase
MNLISVVKNNYLSDRVLFIKKLLFLMLIPVSGLAYFFANKVNNLKFLDVKPFIFKFPIDDLIPFNKFFILPYFYWYFYVAATLIILFLNKDSKFFFKQVLSMSVGVLFSVLIYLVFPTYVPRAELLGNDYLTGMIRNLYVIDPPYNCFPSMHVLYSFICCWYLLIFRRISIWFDILNVSSFVVISLSTVYTKQHYTPDILGGIVVGAIFCSIFTFVKVGNNQKTISKQIKK